MAREPPHAAPYAGVGEPAAGFLASARLALSVRSACARLHLSSSERAPSARCTTPATAAAAAAARAVLQCLQLHMPPRIVFAAAAAGSTALLAATHAAC